MDVTVVIATRNRPSMLERALRSVERQTLRAIEVLVADDSSLEEHRAANRTLIAGFDARFRVLQPDAPVTSGSGPSAARNRGIHAGVGRYLAFLDDDDQWAWDDYLKTAVTALDGTRADLFCADMQGFRGDALEIDTWFLESTSPMCAEQVSSDPPIYRTSRAAFARSATRRVAHPNMLVLRREVVERAGGFSEDIWFGEDSELALRIADTASGLLFCPRVAARYRLPTGDSISAVTKAGDQTRQVLMAARRVKGSARTPEVRRAARDVEAWTLRVLSREARADGHLGRSVGLAVQGMLAYPTLGGLAELVGLPFVRSARDKGRPEG